MLDFSHLASSSGADVQVFSGVPSSGNTAAVWLKPRGVSMVYIFVVGSGGDGGNGAVGAASTAAGGGGGGSGAQSTLVIPSVFIPDVLFVRAPLFGGSTVSVVNAAYVANNTLVSSTTGGTGGAASGGTAGGAGGAGTIATIAAMPLAGMGRYNFLAGQAGVAGSGTSAGNFISLPTTGLVVTGGAGGGGIGGFDPGSDGGGINGVGRFPYMPGGIGQQATTTPAGDGNPGIQAIQGLTFFYGGTGGGSTGPGAIGAGLVAGNGGNGAAGCGGGGGGGGFTGSTQGLGGRGGPGLVIIIAW